MSEQPKFDSILLVSFGGPEGPDDVLPFLENVLRGKNVPQRANDGSCRALPALRWCQPHQRSKPRPNRCSTRLNLTRPALKLPIYWGNRNWNPMLADTLREMRADGRQRAVAFFTSMFSCYSGCRQYRENIQVAQQEVGEGAPIVRKSA